MARPELTVMVNMAFDVDKNTAETCLRLVEAYVNRYGVDILCTVQEDGKRSFAYTEKNGGVDD